MKLNKMIRRWRTALDMNDWYTSAFKREDENGKSRLLLSRATVGQHWITITFYSYEFSLLTIKYCDEKSLSCC